MKPAGQINLVGQDFIQKPQLQRLFSILNQDGLNARLVGGCVRDILLGKNAIGDLDIACSLSPEESMKRLKDHKAHVIPTGLKHGTITAVIDRQHFEITALRHDVKTDGRHAEVAFTDDWQGDAARRDLTFNAIYMDLDGTYYDPCGGVDDLKAQKIRFIGDSVQRIQEDALRILRFFRFAAQFATFEMDEEGLVACSEQKALITGLSGERLAQELWKLLPGAAAGDVIPVMVKNGILDHILPDHVGDEVFIDYVRTEEILGRCFVEGRLAALLPQIPERAEKMARHLKLSNKHITQISNLAEERDWPEKLSEKALRREVYLYGRDVVGHHLILKGVMDKSLYDLVDGWEIPKFPLRGQDLIDKGTAAGPAVGRAMKQLEQQWIDSDFSLSREDLLA